MPRCAHLEHDPALPCAEVPSARDAVKAACGQQRARRIKGDARHRTAVTLQGGETNREQ